MTQDRSDFTFELLPPEEIQSPSGEVLEWAFLHPAAPALIGYIPNIILASDPRPAADQINERYAHGGGWCPIDGWTRNPDNSIQYPGDPPMRPIATARLCEETIFIYQYAWVMILQPNCDFEIARMD